MSPETIYPAAMALAVCPDSFPDLEPQASVENEFNNSDLEKSTKGLTMQEPKDEAESDFENTTTPNLDHSDEVTTEELVQKMNSRSISMTGSESAVSSLDSALLSVGTHLLQIRLQILTDD
jgi:hypothetical protein